MHDEMIFDLNWKWIENRLKWIKNYTLYISYIMNMYLPMLYQSESIKMDSKSVYMMMDKSKIQIRVVIKLNNIK